MSNPKRARRNEDIRIITPAPVSSCCDNGAEDGRTQQNDSRFATVRFPITLGDLVGGSLIDQPEAQQKRQRSEAFERFGLHWLVALEKLPGDSNSTFDVQVLLFCLSVAIDEEEMTNSFPLKGDIPIDNHQAFNARRRQFCDVVGKGKPANAVLMKEGFTLTLQSGNTKSEETHISMWSIDDKGDEDMGGYYGSGWHGAGEVLLKNHTFDPVRDGAAIEVRVRFDGRSEDRTLPRPLCYM